MCFGENSAPHATHYLNAQLTALWENATECVAHHGNGLKPSDSQKYSFSLAEFFYGKHRGRGHASKADMMFHAYFGRPQLEFICNHDALLRLHLKEGHYNTEFAKATSENITANHERNRSFTDVEVAFRVPFSFSRIRGSDAKIGNGSHIIKMLILDFTKAQLVSVTPEVETGRQALAFYLSQYLKFLNNAGHHVLFSLPDFDDDDFSITMDFSAISKSIVTVDEISACSREPSIEDRIKASLAEYRSVWVNQDSDIHFHVRMSAPRVRALCQNEVILYFPVDEAYFYDSDNFDCEPKHKFFNWEIAIVVNLTYVEEGDFVTRCMLDLKRSARYVRQFSKFPDLDINNTECITYWTSLIEFFNGDFIGILESAEYHIVYHEDKRWPKHDKPVIPGGDDDSPEQHWTGGDSGDELPVDVGTRKEVVWKEVTEKTDMCGFDQITAISQASLNEHFRSLWQVARSGREKSLYSWKYEEFFEATFKPISLRLLSNGRAIVWVHLQGGFLKTLRNWVPWNESKKYNFEDWSLAFEVNLKMCSHSDVDGVSSDWFKKFEESYAFKEHGKHEDRVLKHLYLDFRHAEFIHEFSVFDGLFHGEDRRPIDKVQAIVTYIKSHYFTHLASRGLHILHTLPVWKAGTTPPCHGLTSVIFQVYSRENLERHTWGSFSKSPEPVIVVLGMCGFRSLPCIQLKFSTSWIIRVNKAICYGTVCLSKRTFLDERLLHLLSRINALTTVIPMFSGVDNGAWRLDLTTWAKSEMRKDRPCQWVHLKEHDGLLKYKWQHRDVWHYEHEGESDYIIDGVYKASCITKNYLEIPTSFTRGALSIKVHGEVELKMSFLSFDGKTNWSTGSTAEWCNTVSISAQSTGLKVESVGTGVPTFHKIKVEGTTSPALFTDPLTLLKNQLPAKIDMAQIVHEFKIFEGAWHGCFPGMSAYALGRPVFNNHGDILCELRPIASLTAHKKQDGHHAHPPSVKKGSNGRSSTIAKTRPVLVPRSPSFLQKVKEVAIDVRGAITGEQVNHSSHHHHHSKTSITSSITSSVNSSKISIATNGTKSSLSSSSTESMLSAASTVTSPFPDVGHSPAGSITDLE
ncbi:hypothetical protein ABKN59_007566 [Abortiporus biennis]